MILRFLCWLNNICYKHATRLEGNGCLQCEGYAIKCFNERRNMLIKRVQQKRNLPVK